VNIDQDLSIAVSKQVMDKKFMDLDVREFFQSVFAEAVGDLDKRIASVLDAVNFSTPLEKKIADFSG